MDKVTPEDRDQRIDDAIADLLRAEQSQTPIDISNWLETHSELREELILFLNDRQTVKKEFSRAINEQLDDSKGFSPGDHFDGLRIISPIKSGGMGRIFKAIQIGLDREVAIKTVRAVGPVSTYLELFKQEVWALGRLRHPNIVSVYGCGERKGLPYLVMDLMSCSLRDRLIDGPIQQREAARIVLEVSKAVQHAIDQKLLHQDIKPSNILLDKNGTPCLSDFGLVARLSAENELGSQAGTTAYKAPEQFAGSTTRFSEHSDIYGLGAVLYECLTGQPPLKSDATVWTPPVLPSKINPKVDRKLEKICLKCLELKPEDRYPTAHLLANDLERYLHPVSRRMFFTSCATLATVSVGAGLWWRSSRQKRRDDLCKELLADIRDRAIARPLGWTWANRKAISEAAVYDTQKKYVVQLRSELARTFTTPNLRLIDMYKDCSRYVTAAFRPGSKGNEIALGMHWRNRNQYPPGRAKIDLYNRQSGKIIKSWELPFWMDWEYLRKKTDGVSALAFSPDGNWLFAASRSGGIYTIDLTRENSLPNELVRESDTVKHLFPNPDGKTLITLCLGGELRRFDLIDNKWQMGAKDNFPTVYPKKPEPTAAIVPETNDLYVVSPVNGNGELVLGIRYNSQLEELDRRQIDYFQLPSFHPKAPFVATDSCGNLRVLEIRNLLDGNLNTATMFQASQLIGQLEWLGFIGDGQILYSGTDDETTPHTRFWDSATFTSIGDVIVAGGIGHISKAPDAPLIAMTAHDKVHFLEYTSTNPEMKIGLHGHAIEEATITAEKKIIRTLCDHDWNSWDAASGSWLGRRSDTKRIAFPNEQNSSSQLGLDAVSLIPGLALHDIRDSAQSQDPNDASDYFVFSKSQNYNLVNLSRGKLKYIPVTNMTIAQKELIQSAYQTGAVASARQEDKLFFCLANNIAVAVNTKGEMLNVILLGRMRWTIATFRKDDGSIIVGDVNGNLYLVAWPQLTFTNTYRVHEGAITSIVALGNEYFASSGRDGYVVIFRIEDSNIVTIAKIPFGRPVKTLSSSAEGTVLCVLCDEERSVRLWRMDQLATEWENHHLGKSMSFPPPQRNEKTIPNQAVRKLEPGLRLVIFKKQWFEEPIIEAIDFKLEYDWKREKPHPNAPNEFYSITWQGYLKPLVSGRYRIRITADDFGSVYLDDKQVAHFEIAKSGVIIKHEYEVELNTTNHDFRVEYVQYIENASIKVEWTKLGREPFPWQPIDPKCLFHSKGNS